MNFDRWTESIAQKVRRRKKVDQGHERKAIWHSVFEPQIIIPGNPSRYVRIKRLGIFLLDI